MKKQKKARAYNLMSGAVCLAAAGLMAGAMVWAEFEAKDSLTAGVLALGIMAMLLREAYYQWRQDDRRL